MRRLIISLLVIGCVCFADDITLTDGTVLREAQVVRKDSDSAVIRHSEGVQRVSFERLPNELQESLDLTPQAVQARRELAKNEQLARELAQEKLATQQREALETSRLSPRYLTGADVMALYSAWDTLSAAAAEYLAAEWNRREALRCNLTVESDRYAKDAQQLSARMENERADLLKQKRQVASLKEELNQARADLKKAQNSLHSYKEEYEKLSKQQQESPSTVVISEPNYVPVYRPNPIVLPPVIVRPTPPPPPHGLRPPLHGPMGPRPKPPAR